jgi:hypothetical protein
VKPPWQVAQSNANSPANHPFSDEAIAMADNGMDMKAHNTTYDKVFIPVIIKAGIAVSLIMTFVVLYFTV